MLWVLWVSKKRISCQSVDNGTDRLMSYIIKGERYTWNIVPDLDGNAKAHCIIATELDGGHTDHVWILTIIQIRDSNILDKNYATSLRFGVKFEYRFPIVHGKFVVWLRWREWSERFLHKLCDLWASRYYWFEWIISHYWYCLDVCRNTRRYS